VPGLSEAHIREGAQMAMEEINAEGGLKGKPLRLVYFDNAGDQEQNAQLSRMISKDPSFNAIVGSYFSGLAIDTLVATHAKDLVYIIIGAETPNLTSFSFQHAIRAHFNTNDYIDALSTLMHCRGYRSLAIIEDQSEYASVSAARLVKDFKENGGKNTYERIVPTWVTDFRDELSDKSVSEADVIYATVGPEQLPTLLTQIKEFGLKADVYADTQLLYPQAPEMLGPSSEDLYILSPMKSMALWWTSSGDAERKSPATLAMSTEPGSREWEFHNKYFKKYNQPPDFWSVEIYDALKLYAQAVQESGALEASALFSTIRFKDGWQIVKGTVHFTPEGEMREHVFYPMQIRNGRFMLPFGENPVQRCE
jgi:branched-chain amino acid transport system substrate-binding protein